MQSKLTILTLAVCAILWACSGSKASKSGEPKWVTELIDSLESAEYNNGASVSKYLFQGNTVYYVQAPCCDQMNPLYDADGTLICHPDGGFTGKGDGKCPGFRNSAEMLEVLWKANAQADP